jgi:putative ABC transport system substrate-binding protein
VRRRDFTAGLAGVAAASAAAWPYRAGAQQPKRSVPVIGHISLGTGSDSISLRNSQAFQRGLRENGYVVGETIEVENRYYGNDPEKLRAVVDQLVQQNVDLILASSTEAGLAAKRATTTIPIVCIMADPVADGLIASLARPGGNVTGATFIGPMLGPKRFQLLKEIVPAATRFAALQHPRVYSERTMQGMASELEEQAGRLGVALRIFSARGPEEFEAAFEAMRQWQAEGLMTFPSPMFYVNYRRLVELTASQRLPTIYVHKEAVTDGGLMFYGSDLPSLWRLAARYAAKILHGAKPGDLPVEQPTTFELAINLRTARTLGLAVPPPLLSRADEVIE